MAQKSVFSFSDPAQYFEHLQSNYPGRSKKITLAQFANLLEYRSPRSIAMVMKGSRLPSVEMVERVAEKASLTETEKNYLQLIVRKSFLERKRKPTEKLAKKIQALKKSERKKRSFGSEAEKYTQDWYHEAIYHLTQTPQFQEDVNWIVRELKNRVTKAQVQSSLEILQNLNLIKRNENGKLCDVHPDETLISQMDVPSKYIQESHRQYLELSQRSLLEDSVLDRYFLSVGLRVKPGQLDSAKKKFRQFYSDFIKEFWDDEGSEIFRLGIQYFPLNRKASLHD